MIMWQLRNTIGAPDNSNYSLVLNYIKSCKNVDKKNCENPFASAFNK
jgi:hypothetical protein